MSDLSLIETYDTDDYYHINCSSLKDKKQAQDKVEDEENDGGDDELNDLVLKEKQQQIPSSIQTSTTLNQQSIIIQQCDVNNGSDTDYDNDDDDYDGNVYSKVKSEDGEEEKIEDIWSHQQPSHLFSSSLSSSPILHSHVNNNNINNLDHYHPVNNNNNNNNNNNSNNSNNNSLQNYNIIEYTEYLIQLERELQQDLIYLQQRNLQQLRQAQHQQQQQRNRFIFNIIMSIILWIILTSDYSGFADNLLHKIQSITYPSLQPWQCNRLPSVSDEASQFLDNINQPERLKQQQQRLQRFGGDQRLADFFDQYVLYNNLGDVEATLRVLFDILSLYPYDCSARFRAGQLFLLIKDKNDINIVHGEHMLKSALACERWVKIEYIEELFHFYKDSQRYHDALDIISRALIFYPNDSNIQELQSSIFLKFNQYIDFSKDLGYCHSYNY